MLRTIQRKSLKIQEVPGEALRERWFLQVSQDTKHCVFTVSLDRTIGQTARASAAGLTYNGSLRAKW
jgi:hypothetical protein